jgi:hypothetical protein
MKTEKDLFNYYKRQCNKKRVTCYKLRAEHVTGWPDLFLAYRGRVFLVELKSPAKTGRLRERQKIIRNKLLLQGVNVYVSDSKESADEIITKLTDG